MTVTRPNLTVRRPFHDRILTGEDVWEELLASESRHNKYEKK